MIDLVKIPYVLKHLHGRMILVSFKKKSWRLFLERKKLVISLVPAKKIIRFFCHGDHFYKQPINSTIRTKYIDDNGTDLKPKQFFLKAWIGKIVDLVTVQEGKCGIDI